MKSKQNKKDMDFLDKAIYVSSIGIWVAWIIYISYHYWCWFFSFPDPPTPFILFVAAIIYSALFPFLVPFMRVAFLIGILICALADKIYKIIIWLTNKLKS